jgi:serine/threonine protein kinase
MEDLISELSKSSLFTVADKTIAAALESEEQTRQAIELLGTIVDSKYKILKLLGAGGMGSVYLAKHLMLDKEVALKTFKSTNLTQEEKLRFQREAQAIAKLSNANVIEVFDFGYVNGEVPYYTMERLVGQSLREKLDDCLFLSVDEAVSIFIQVCHGLLAAHKKRIIHRDLKPDNIFLQSQPNLANTETVKIVDFGIASLALPAIETQKLTTLGAVFGSPLYMSPEQSMGQPVTESSDIYSCGCTLFQALTGKPPYLGNNALTTLLLHQSAPIPSLRAAMNGRTCPKALEELLAKMLAKSADDRYANVEEVLQLLLRLDETIQHSHRSTSARGRFGGEASLGEDSSEEEEEEEEDDAGDDLDDNDEAGTERASLRNNARSGVYFVAITAATISTLGMAIAVYFYMIGHAEKLSKPKETAPSISSSISKQSQIRKIYPPADDLPQINMDRFEHKLKTPTADNRLIIEQFSKLSNKEFTRIANTNWIENLTISRCEFENKNLSQLTKLKLQRVNLNHTAFNDQGAKAISPCQTLVEIKAENTLITDAGVKELASIKALEILRLTHTAVTADGIKYLCQKNKKCATIYLAECPRIGQEEMKKLRQQFHHVNFITAKKKSIKEALDY